MHAAVHRVLVGVVEFQGAVGWLHVPSEAETAGWLEAELSLVRAGRAAFAGAYVDDVLQGVGLWARFAAPVLSRNGQVRKLMTHPAARGSGVGRAVLQALEADARAAAVENLVLDVRGNNHAAMALYESLGWRRYSVLRDFISVGEDRFDQVSYVRELTRPAGARLHGERPDGPGASTRRA